ncbi:MAG: hypothetical protein COA58_08570 [Bacteroidetes bacterium]|nr:MAG: hypothetical protein COA58_08570 [Bacteroidota bacterium]
MQPKTNRKKPDRIILFEIGIILALLFVNYALNISYRIAIPEGPFITDGKEDEVFVLGVIIEPQLVEPQKQEVQAVASIFNPIAIIKPVIDILFETKETKIALPTLPKIGSIKQIVVKPRIDSTTLVVDFPDILPQFPGGEKALNKYILDNYNIPDIVFEMTDQVKLVLEFVVDKNGQVSDFKILENSNPGLGTEREAKRIYMKMPAWTPGKNHGRPAHVRLRQPLTIQVY